MQTGDAQRSQAERRLGSGFISLEIQGESVTADNRRLSVLLVNQYFPPDHAATAAVFADLVAAFGRAGHHSEVLCGRPSYETAERSPWRPLRREVRRGTQVERVGSTAFARVHLPARIVNYVSFLVLGLLRALTRRRRDDTDVVVSGSDPPLAILVALIASRGARVVYFLRDLHPEAAVSAGWISPGPVQRTWETIHRWALRRSDLVVCLSDKMARRVIDKGVSRSRVTVVPDGAPAPSGAPINELVSKLRGGRDFVIVHAGNIGVAGAWDTLLSALDRIDPEIELVLVGDGVRAAELRERGVRIEPFTTEVASVMAAGDMQLVTQRADMEGLMVPSKLYTALAYGRPVLAVCPHESEVARIVERWECGILAGPEDPGDLVEKIRAVREHPATLGAMAEGARRAGRRFDRGIAFDRLVEVIEAPVADVETVPQ
jgi:colanic acid biosynthesis glycosyl transferase WcaI